MDVDSLYRFVVHVDVPDLQSQVVAGEYISTIVAKVDIRDGRYDFREEGAAGWILGLFKHC
jgi:hypothetical protein